MFFQSQLNFKCKMPPFTLKLCLYDIHFEIVVNSEIAIQHLYETFPLSSIIDLNQPVEHKIYWLDVPLGYNDTDWNKSEQGDIEINYEHNLYVGKSKYILRHQKNSSLVYSPYCDDKGFEQALKVILAHLLKQRGVLSAECLCLLDADNKAHVFLGWNGFLSEISVPYLQNKKYLSGKKALLFYEENILNIKKFNIYDHEIKKYEIIDVFYLYKSTHIKAERLIGNELAKVLNEEYGVRIDINKESRSHEIFRLGCVLNKKSRTYDMPKIKI